MGVFVDYKSKLYPDRADSNDLILDASDQQHHLLVNSIIVCNRGPQSIRFNLKNNRVASGGNTIIFLINEFEIGPYKTVDVAESLGLEIFLQYTDDNNYDRIRCYSNGRTQIFDCQVSYTVLKDTPVA